MENQTQITIFIFIAFIAMMCPAAIIAATLNMYKRKMLDKEAAIKQLSQEKQIESFRVLVETEERERAVIAANLHDGVIPNLCAIQSNLEAQASGLTDHHYLEKLGRSMAALTNAISEVRGVTHNLAPPTLAKQGFVAALEEYVEFLEADKRLDIVFDNQTDFIDDFPMPMSTQNNMYRVCLELLQNLRKYANFKSLHIVLKCEVNMFVIEFVHDGKGVSNTEMEHNTLHSKGLGLRSIKSRVTVLNATLDYSFDKDTAGIKLSVPIQKAIGK